MSARTAYSEEFKANAVALLVSSGLSLPVVAADLGISLTALKRWTRLAREADPEGSGSPLSRWIR